MVPVFLPTLREEPKDAEAISHKLMVRAGLIRRLGSGAYSYLPLGMRVLHKVMTIIRQEMTRKNLGQPLMFLSGIGGCSKERDIIRNSIDHEDVLALPPWVRSMFVVRAGEAPLLDGGREVR